MLKTCEKELLVTSGSFRGKGNVPDVFWDPAERLASFGRIASSTFTVSLVVDYGIDVGVVNIGTV